MTEPIEEISREESVFQRQRKEEIEEGEKAKKRSQLNKFK
jgi:hypothetical protein